MANAKVDSLGICVHCNRILNILMFAGDSDLNAIWKCSCGKETTHETFGYDQAGQGARKVKWVGPDSRWTEERPSEDFKLGEVEVSTYRGST